MSDVLEIYDVSTEAIEVVTEGPQGPPGTGGGGGSGTVTSVALASTDLSISGSPITASGTITANIAANAVTLDKLQTISSGHLLGRHGSGNGGVQQVGIGTGLTMQGSDMNVAYGSTAGTAVEGNDGRIAGLESGSTTIGSGAVVNIDDEGVAISTPSHIGELNLFQGGSINTSEGGGSINTRGTGSIELGVSGTRTTFTGSATADRAIALPDASGTVALTSNVPSASSTTPAALGTAAVGTGTTFARADHVHSAEVSDSAFRIADNTTSSKKLAFEISGISTATTRTLSAPDSDGTIALLSNFLGAVKNMAIVSPSSDYTVTSSATLANVTGMSFSVAANTTYLIVSNLQVSVGAGGYDCVLSFPSILNNGTTASGFGVQLPGNNAVAGLSTLTATTVRVSNRGAAQTTPSFSLLLVRTDSTGGTAQFQWCQNTSNAAASTLSSSTRALIVPLTT